MLNPITTHHNHNNQYFQLSAAESFASRKNSTNIKKKIENFRLKRSKKLTAQFANNLRKNKTQSSLESDSENSNKTKNLVIHYYPTVIETQRTFGELKVQTFLNFQL
jgi:hypothetical protein